MSDVLDEVTSPVVDRDSVLARVQDWEERIGRLFRSISSWSHDGWSATIEHASVLLDEEMMRAVDVSPRRLPALHLRKGERRITIEPRSLWMVGTNGRLDVRTPGRTYFIVDRAQNFEPADWRLIDSRDRLHGSLLTEATLRSLLESDVAGS